MKLGFTTYQLPQNLNFEESIRLAKKTGCAGIDFRTGNVYKHGVEVSLSPEERRQMRRMLEDNYLELASINSEYSFDNPDENERRKSIEGAKQCCLLASDFGSRLVRLFGNIIRTDDAHETVKYVSDAIREVCDYAATKGMNVELEVFDYDMDKAALIGPAPYAAQFAADMRTTHSNFGLLVDLSHFPTTYETSKFVVRTLRPYITHFQFGNAVGKPGCDG